MNLYQQGFRYILRAKEGRVEGNWEHPATIQPGGFDATDLSDEAMAEVVKAIKAIDAYRDVCNG